MKKVFLLFVTCIMLNATSAKAINLDNYASAYASNPSQSRTSVLSTTYKPHSTNLQDAFEFTETCMMRIVKYNNMFGEHISLADFKPFSFNMPIYLDSEIRALSNSFASMNINRNDFKILSATINFIDLRKNGEDVSISIERAVLAFSSLEYDSGDDSLMELNYKYGLSEYKNAVDASYNIIINQVFNPIMDNKLKWWRIVENGEKLLLYEGNYNWFVKYYEYTVNGETYMYIQLIADAK